MTYCQENHVNSSLAVSSSHSPMSSMSSMSSVPSVPPSSSCSPLGDAVVDLTLLTGARVTGAGRPLHHGSSPTPETSSITSTASSVTSTTSSIASTSGSKPIATTETVTSSTMSQTSSSVSNTPSVSSDTSSVATTFHVLLDRVSRAGQDDQLLLLDRLDGVLGRGQESEAMEQDRQSR